MSPADLNMRLLQVFDEVYRTHSVSRAAENLDVGQPSISMSLAKMRAHFGDPLFVRTSGGMEPTPMAQQLAPTVHRALLLLAEALGTQTTFDPGTSERSFCIAMTDITQTLVLPRLLERLSGEAPNVSLRVVRITDQALRGLESGEVDLVLGYVPQMRSGVYQQRLLARDFVCVASSRHPRIDKTLSLAAFNAEAHVLVTASGSGLQHADQILTARHVRRRIQLEVPNLIGLDEIVAGSELLATVNRSVGKLFAMNGRVRMFEHPVKLPSYLVKQHWHERYHLDPGNEWLRRVVADIMKHSRLI